MEQEANSRKDRITLTGEAASGRDMVSSSLLPMLVAGLVLIVIGAVMVMAFV